MQTPKKHRARCKAVECARYFAVNDAHLYTVQHRVPNPIARVLLIGPLASERHFAYHPWVRWARYLALNGIESLRYDYRGVGESTGVFENMSFADWSEDVRLLATWSASQLPRVPLVLHGLEIGAILAGRAFEAGLGNALLLWSPPAAANDALHSNLRSWAGLEQLYESPDNRRPTSDYIRRLEHGDTVEVQGYKWSGRLWSDSMSFCLPERLRGDTETDPELAQFVRKVELKRDAAPLVKPHLMYDEVRDLTWLYSENLRWILDIVAMQAVENNDSVHTKA